MSTTPNVPYRLEFSVEVPGTPEQVWQAIGADAASTGTSSARPTDGRAGDPQKGRSSGVLPIVRRLSRAVTSALCASSSRCRALPSGMISDSSPALMYVKVVQ
jgi:hypothetical protein